MLSINLIGCCLKHNRSQHPEIAALVALYSQEAKTTKYTFTHIKFEYTKNKSLFLPCVHTHINECTCSDYTSGHISVELLIFYYLEASKYKMP